MKKFRWQLLIIFLTGLVVGFLLLGEQPQPNTIEESKPQTGGVYSEALIGKLQRLNPLLDFYNSVDRDVDRLLYSSLVKFGERGIAELDLAESWGVSKDGSIYTFTIRPDAKWHDGAPVTNKDVEFTIDMLRKGEGVVPQDLISFWNSVEVNISGDKTVQFKLPEPFAPFLDYLTFGILPSHKFSGSNFADMVASEINIDPVGSGPFQFERLIVEDDKIIGVVLNAYDDYYGQKPFIEGLVFQYFDDEDTAFQAYKNNEVMGISQISNQILPEALAEPNLAIYTSREPQLSMVLFNLKNQETDFLQNANVRKALLLAINRQYMINHLLNGQAIIADGPVFPETWAYYDGITHFDYDVQQAQNLLKDEGYILENEDATVRSKDLVKLSFSMIYPDTSLHQQIAEMIQQDWAKIGVEVNLEAVAYDQLINERLTDRAYQAALVDLNLSKSPDPDPYPFWDQVQSSGGQNYSQWNNQTASDYLEQARVSVDLEERTKLYRNFQVIWSEDLPALPLYYPVYNYGVSRNVLGVSVGPLYDTSDRFETIQNWYFISANKQEPTVESTP
ncbi:MAG: ABC transporter substrate-binding protein [Anaerolineaceae bacterium]